VAHETWASLQPRALGFVALLSALLLAAGPPVRAEPAAAPERPVDAAKTSAAASADDQDDLAKYGRLEASIRAVAQRDHIPTPVIEALIRIFADNVDLQRTAQPGDGFVVVTEPTGNRRHGRGERIVFAALTRGGQTDRFYRFATRRGAIGYFDDNGRSAGKLLLRRPLRDGMLISSFGTRRHPILDYMGFHTGVDFAAAAGTPIYAAGPARVEIAGWRADYGKLVRLRHSGGYQTAYAHLSRIARGVAPGARVRQGQLIGYVGATGLSTGPRLHYEVLVNSRYVDPLRIRLPAQRVLRAAMLARFDQERERLDAVASRDGQFHALIAQNEE